MSNIHSSSAHHGVDDEFDYGQPVRCQFCWRQAKVKFFSSPLRRGVTLTRVYNELHASSHDQGNRY